MSHLPGRFCTHSESAGCFPESSDESLVLLSQVKDRLTCCSGCTSFTPGHNLRCSCKPTDILYACLCTLCLEGTGLHVPELRVYPDSHSHATVAPLHQHSAISLSTTLLICRAVMPPSCHRQGSAQCKIIVVHVVNVQSSSMVTHLDSGCVCVGNLQQSKICWERSCCILPIYPFPCISHTS